MISTKKYGMSEGKSSVMRSLLLMNYDLNKTYTENLNEQVILGGPSFLPLDLAMANVGEKIYYDSKNLGKLIVNLSQGNFSDGILDFRNFLFSDTGIVTDISITYAGQEFGGPILMAILEWVTFANDFYRYKNNIGDQNENIRRVIEDLCIIGLMFAMKGVIGAFSFAVAKIRGKATKELVEIIVDNVDVNDVDNGISMVINESSKLGKFGKWIKDILESNREKIKKFVSDKIEEVKKIKKITDKTVRKEFAKKLPKSIFKGILLNKLINYSLESETAQSAIGSLTNLVFGQKKEEPNTQKTPTDKKLEENLYKALREQNPEIFKNVPSTVKIEVIYQYDVGFAPIFKIMGKEYVLVDPTDPSADNWKIKLKN